MTKDVKLGWIAQAEAQHFEECATAQRGPCEPPISVVFAAPGAPRHHWVRRLLARLGAKPGLSGPADGGADGRQC